jgi:signal transduction histidine kinase
MLLTAGLVAGGVLLGGVRPVPLWFAAMAGAAALVPLAAMFCYKNRQRQTSLLVAGFVVLAGALGFAIWYAWWARTAWNWSPMLLFGSIFTNWLALRGVLRDEAKVRGADRIR